MIPTDLAGIEQVVSTGALPSWNRVDELVVEAHRRYTDDTSGAVADYIPILAAAEPSLFGLAVVEVTGGVHDSGDSLEKFSIQSISKMFVYALAIQKHAHEKVRDIVGVNNTGMAFNSVMALELNDGHPMNPMVNAGAIATTALMPGALDGTAHDLAVTGATLADGGVNPITGERVISADVCRYALAVVAASGPYEKSGEWLFEIGIPAKSGVSGGIVAIAPGKGAVGAFSPRLDSAGNSVRSQLAIAYLSRALGLNLFASAPRVGASSEG